MLIDGDYMAFVSTEHAPRLLRRSPMPRTEMHILCACGVQTKWRHHGHRVLVQQDWVEHIRQEWRKRGQAQS